MCRRCGEGGDIFRQGVSRISKILGKQQGQYQQPGPEAAPFDLPFLFLHLEAGFHLLQGLVLLLLEILLDMENIVVVRVQGFFTGPGAGVEPHQAVIQARGREVVGILQSQQHLLEIPDRLFVAVALLEPAGAEQDAVPAEAGQVIGIGQCLALVQPPPGGAIKIRVDGGVPPVLVDICSRINAM